MTHHPNLGGPVPEDSVPTGRRRRGGRLGVWVCLIWAAATSGAALAQNTAEPPPAGVIATPAPPRTMPATPTEPVLTAPNLEASDPTPPDPRCPEDDTELAAFCEHPGAADPLARKNKPIVICVNACGAGRPRLVTVPTGHTMRPNRPIYFYVQHRGGAGQQVNVKLSGNLALIMPGTVNGTTRPNAAPLAKALIRRFEFGPRGVGPVTATVEVQDGAVARSMTVELVVKETYLGALRMGVGLALMGAVDRAYEGRLQPTPMGMPGTTPDKLYKVAATTDNPVDFELVFGFAPFLFDLFGGGRTYVNGENLKRLPLGLSPYIGVGLLGTGGPGSVNFFKTLYLGGEWEPMPNFSVTVAWVLRRVNRLDPGVNEGDLLPTDAVPQITTHESGLGVVINVTPEFFRFSK